MTHPPDAEYEYGFIKVDISGHDGNFELVVWDRGSNQPIGREICRKTGLPSINYALEEAASCIALDTGREAEQIHKDFREYHRDDA